MADLIRGKRAKEAKAQLGRMAPASQNLFPLWLSSAMRASRLGQIWRSADLGEIGPAMAFLMEILAKDIGLSGLMNVRASAVEQMVIQCQVDETDKSVSDNTKEEIRQFCQNILDNIQLVRRQADNSFASEGGLSTLTRRISVNSSWLGFFAGWPIWDVIPGTSNVIPVAVEYLDPRRFKVNIQDDSLLLLSNDNLNGQPFYGFGEFNTMEVRHQGVSAKLAESSLGRSASYAWFILFSTYVMLLRYVEMTSVPSPVIERAGIDGITPGYTPGNDTEALNFLKNYIAGIQAIMPAGFKLNWSEPGKNGHYLFDFIDKMVGRQYKDLILGQASTTSESGSALGGLPIAGMQIQEYIVMGEMAKVCNAYRRLLTLAVRLNFGPMVRPPKVGIVRDNIAQRLQKIQILKEAKGLGFPISRAIAARELGLALPTEGEILLDGTAYSAKAKVIEQELDEVSTINEEDSAKEGDGKGIPVGTRRKWKNGTFEKQEDGSWKKVE
jgi:hypothetical protein